MVLAEKKKSIRFKGHETFTIREGWINKGLTEIRNNPYIFNINYGADDLGVGPNMAKAIRYWLKCAGLTEEKQREGVKLSSVGEMIFEYDPYIEDVFTLWLIHCRIAQNREQATAWNLFFNEFGYEEFDRSQLMTEMKELVYLAAEQIAPDKKVADTSVESDCDAILHMYAKKGDKNGTPEEKNVSPFGKLELIKIIDGKYVRKQPDLNRLPETVVLYLLVDCIGKKKSVHMDELLTIPNGPGKLLQLKRNGLAELLEKLASKELIIMNRTAGLNMIYFPEEISTEKVVEDYYRGNL